MPSVRTFQSASDPLVSITVLPLDKAGYVVIELLHQGDGKRVRIPIPLTTQDVADLCIELDRAVKPAGKGGRGGSW